MASLSLRRQPCGRWCGATRRDSEHTLTPAPRALTAAVDWRHTDDPALELVAGDSAEQRAAEGVMLAMLGRELGVALKGRRFLTPSGAGAEVDGVSEDPRVLVEAWAHQGPPKSAQKARVPTDAIKLVWLEQRFLPGARKILLFSDPAAARHFQGRIWAAAAIADLRIALRVVELPAEQQAAIRAAQVRQFR